MEACHSLQILYCFICFKFEGNRHISMKKCEYMVDSREFPKGTYEAVFAPDGIVYVCGGCEWSGPDLVQQ
jgi:hypothetical protein